MRTGVWVANTYIQNIFTFLQIDIWLILCWSNKPYNMLCFYYSTFIECSLWHSSINNHILVYETIRPLRWTVTYKWYIWANSPSVEYVIWEVSFDHFTVIVCFSKLNNITSALIVDLKKKSCFLTKILTSPPWYQLTGAHHG